MKLATVRTATGTAPAWVDPGDGPGDGPVAVELGAADLGEYLARPDWRSAAPAATGAHLRLAELDFAPLIPHPEKVFCVGLNYRTHIRELPAYSKPFAKFARALVGAHDPVGAHDVFGPADLVAYISQLITLVPGTIIATEIPGGVGHARTPPRYLTEGAELVTRIEGIGELRNTCVKGG